MDDFFSTVVTLIFIKGSMSSSILVPGPHSIVHICPQQPVAESVTCRSTQMLQWRVTFGGSLTLSDVTMQYIPSDPVGRTDVATRNGLNFAFNLTVNNQSQLVSIMMVTGQINATTNITVHCGQDILHLSWIAVQEYTKPPASPVITNESITIVSGDSHGIAIGLEWTSSDATIVNNYVIKVSPPIASVSTFTTASTSIQLFVLYNQEYNISVLATNCAGNSTPMETDVKIGYCVPPIIVGSNVTVVRNSSGLEGTVITYYCQQSEDNPPVETMVAVCTRDGYWSPNPSELECPLNWQSYVTTNSWTDNSENSLSTSEGRKSNAAILISVSFTISLILVLIFGLLMGFLLAKCCLKPYPMLQNDKTKAPHTVDSSIPIYEQVNIFHNQIMDQNSIELENNVAYGPIQPKYN